MTPSSNFYLSAAALAVGIGGGVYFFIEWLLHRRAYQFLLFWAIGSFGLFLFQIPVIISNANVALIVTNFNKFFSIVITVAFLSLIAIYFGLYSIIKPVSKRMYIIFAAWIAVAFAFFAYFFWYNTGFTSRLPLYGIIVLFFLPIHFLNISAVWKLWRRTADGTPAIYKTGLVVILLAILCGLGRNIIYLYGFTAYPPIFWFLALQYPELFWLQILGILGVVGGFLMVHKCLITGRETAIARSTSL